MFERRVLRGAPFKLLKKQEVVDASASSILLREKLLRAQCATTQGPRAAQQQQQRRQQQQQAARSALDSLESARSARERDVGLQTDPHLVLLTAAAKETEAAAQTDKTADRPVSPLVAPKAELVDADTQIQEGELFNFDEEVVPVLEVLVGRVIEQSLNEVIEEEELRAIRQQREAFERERLQQLIEVQALEAAEERRQQEAARRLAEEAALQKLRGFAAQKAAAAACAGRLLWGLEETILEEMRESREFVKPLTVSCRASCMQCLSSGVCAALWGWTAATATAPTAAGLSQTNSQVMAGVVAAALAPGATELAEIVAMRQRKAARHVEKKLQQVGAFDKLLARRKQEAEERRQMAAADTLEETRAWEQSIRDREQKAEDLNVLLLEEPAPETDPTEPNDLQEGEEEAPDEAAEEQ
ncbi:hypothetical protein ACSSS7_007109 [Eimeria intestinalis]